MRMATRRKVANLLALAVLAYLAKQPMHPYQLGRTLRDHDDARSIRYNHGSLYMVFEQLTRAGFIVAQETSRAGQRPERTVYALTDAGRRELRDWLRELVEEPQHEYPQFVAALSLIGALPPGEAVELLGRRLDRLTAQRAEVRGLIDGTLAAGAHPLFLVEEDYRLALLDAESAFVEQLIDRITDPETGWGPRWEEAYGQAASSHERPPT
jgi:DNA-binding PadR family transcriptional regulator